MKTLLAALAAMTLAAPVVAQDTAPQQAATPKPVADKKMCRQIQSTGSMMVKRECHLRSEWAAIDQTNAAAAQSTLDRNNRSGR